MSYRAAAALSSENLQLPATTRPLARGGGLEHSGGILDEMFPTNYSSTRSLASAIDVSWPCFCRRCWPQEGDANHPR